MRSFIWLAGSGAPGGSEPAPPGTGFERILIVGLGLIGGSLALAFRRAGFQGRIAAVSGPEAIAEGRRLGAIEAGVDYGGLASAAEEADLIVLATPIHRILEHLSILGRARLAPGTVVTDVGSTKREILAAAEAALPRGVHFIGGHPLAGSEKRGISAADPFLFQNAYWVLTPGKGCPPEALGRLGDFVRRTGARVTVLPAGDHDRIAAAISHLPQLLAVALVNSLEDLGPLRDAAVLLAAGGFRDMTRIASSPFAVWRDILATNRPEITRALERFGGALAGTRALVEGAGRDESEVEGRFRKAGAVRAAIPRDTKGFLHTLHDVLVVVEDRPGVIAGISGALSKRGINIQDIEVLKVREGEGGTLRLGFATRHLAEEAIAILTAGGFSARLRE